MDEWMVSLLLFHGAGISIKQVCDIKVISIVICFFSNLKILHFLCPYPTVPEEVALESSIIIKFLSNSDWPTHTFKVIICDYQYCPTKHIMSAVSPPRRSILHSNNYVNIANSIAG